jgi:hypothetical protein
MQNFGKLYAIISTGERKALSGNNPICMAFDI